MHTPKHKLVIALFLSAVGVSFCCLGAADAGRFLVIDRPEHSDIIVVLSGDIDDIRAKHGLMLLRKGYAKQLILDAPDWSLYGRNQAEAAEDYLRGTAPDQVGRVHVCRFSSDSTRQELTEVSNCIHTLAPATSSGIVVTSSYHTRRAFAIAQHTMPQYHWSVAAVPDPQFDVHWWLRREHAKTVLIEWQRLLWWTIVERWTVKMPAYTAATQKFVASGSGWSVAGLYYRAFAVGNSLMWAELACIVENGWPR
ncbi:MAG TPA: YdcF family protein [Terracidiphilus sp.]|jgi:uncharacterized SAM-binding protein YcdF (DUF218 family)